MVIAPILSQGDPLEKHSRNFCLGYRIKTTLKIYKLGTFRHQSIGFLRQSHPETEVTTAKSQDDKIGVEFGKN